MFTIHVDGALLFSTDQPDDAHIVLSPKLSLDANGAGSLTFVIPPGNALYDSIRKIKSIITVKEDEAVIFRGRAMEIEKDFFNQKNVYCEGDLSFLLDSVYAPGTYKGKVLDFFSMLIESHNAQVDEEKHFSVGVVDAVEADEPFEHNDQLQTRRYWSVSEILNNKLLDVYGGYLRTRTEGDAHYIDWLKRSGPDNSQVIEFSVNMLDLKDRMEAADVFTILIPQGYSEIDSEGNHQDPVSIKSVNGGAEYVQDDESVERYGKIWRTQTWDYIKEPAKLLEKAREYLKTGVVVQTLTLKAVDMHFLDPAVSSIRIGEYVRILSDPHGIDITLGCSKIDLDLLNPENTTYTFGEPPRTLTDNVVRTEDNVNDMTGGGRGGGGGGRSMQEELSDIFRWAKIQVDEANAHILLTAGEVNKLTEEMTTANIEIDGLNANILLKADSTTVDELGKRVTSAEIEIDGLNSEITLKADKIDLQGYVTASQLSTELANMELGLADSITTRTLNVTGATTTSTLNATNASISNLRVGGYGIGLESATFLTSSTTLTVNSTGGTVTGVTLNKKTASINYLGW